VRLEAEGRRAPPRNDRERACLCIRFARVCVCSCVFWTRNCVLAVAERTGFSHREGMLYLSFSTAAVSSHINSY